METDLSELDGKSFSCLDGCGLCCLCQPEVSEPELRLFAGNASLARGLTNERIDGRRTPRPSAVRLQNGRGACHFLRSRRCQIYEMRPRFCRQFPVHVHVSWRVQLNANLSCRGMTAGGGSLRAFGQGVVRAFPEGLLASELESSRGRFARFERSARDAEVWQDWKRLCSAGEAMAPLLGTPGGTGKLLAFADEEPEVAGMPIGKLATVLETTAEPDDLDDVAREGNCDALALDDVAWLPVYVAPDFSWNVFQFKAGKLLWMKLEEDGSLETRGELDPLAVTLLERDAEALAVFGSYARTLVGRDHFLGYAAHVCAEQDYSDDLMTVYAGVLGTAMLDLWWRASLIGAVTGKKAIDGALAREGVIAYDMDCLDAPTIGAFV
jgi:Fe-S-cluster containining protein